MLVPAKKLRILDFDIENRPLSYGGMDFTFSDVTAIAASFVGQRKVYCWLLGEVTTEEMLSGFLALYNEADCVTGHYIRRHDLPIINGALMEFGLPVLGSKITSDTKEDLIKSKGVSKAQESLSDMHEIKARKFHMTQAKWRAANRLTPAGLAETRKRVVGDIRQHKQLRKIMAERNLLKPMKMWRP